MQGKHRNDKKDTKDKTRRKTPSSPRSCVNSSSGLGDSRNRRRARKVLSQQILAIQSAKAQGGSWEKAKGKNIGIDERAWEFFSDGRVAKASDVVRRRASMHRRIRLNNDARLSLGRRLAEMHDSFLEDGGPIGHVLQVSILPRLDLPHWALA